MIPASTHRPLVAIACLVALTGSADPSSLEDEIRALKLSGAASEVHILQTPPDRVAAWRAGAEAGDPAAQWLLGRCYSFGFTVPKDSAQAVAWYRKAADQGYARAQLSYGHALAAGRGVPKDLDEAVRLYRKAADQPDCPEAYEWLIQAYTRGYSVPKDPAKVKELAAKAISAYEKLAGKGYAGARMRLARIFTTGTWGTPVDVEKGLALYRQGLEQGHVYCQTNLADAYLNGAYGLPKDPALGVNLYRMAAAQREPIAERSLAEMYLDAKIPDPDPAEADRLYRVSAPQIESEAATSPHAKYRLAQMAERGAGVPQDDDLAVTLYRQAADAGSSPAALALADRYDTGRGVPKDPAEAARMREQASAKQTK